MSNKITEEFINKKITLSNNITYLKEEFEGKLWGSCPDGDVKLYQMLEFAREYDWLLEDIIKLSKEL
tara:strand:- start:102322 stop:102522 length:201 start_codon:yes stop_codon:yes gene_type:complete